MAALLGAVAVSVINVLLPVSIGKFYELAFHGNSSKAELMSFLHIGSGGFRQFFIFFFSLIALRFVFGFAEKSLNGRLAEKFTTGLRNLLFERQMQQSYATFAQRDASRYLLRYGNDMTAIKNYLTKANVGLLADSLFMLMALFVLFSISSKLVIIVFIGLSAGLLFMWILSKLQRKNVEDRRKRRSDVLEFVASRFHSFATVKTFNRESPETEAFRKKSERFSESESKYIISNALREALLPLLFFAMIGFVLLHIAGNPGSVSQSEVLVFVLLLLYMQRAYKRLLRIPFIRQQGILSFNGLLELLNEPIEERDARADKDFSGKILVKGILSEDGAFSKPLTHIFHNGTITRIEGKQGSGKSTLFRMLLAMQPVSGEIWMEGESYVSLSAHAIRKRITLVSDDAPLMGDTVFHAISYSRKDEKRMKVKSMLNQLCSENSRLLDLDFKLDEHARNISSGERKTLQCARAFLTDKKVLLMDEPFRGMDKPAVQRILRWIEEVRKRKTILIISSPWPDELVPDDTLEI